MALSTLLPDETLTPVDTKKAKLVQTINPVEEIHAVQPELIKSSYPEVLSSESHSDFRDELARNGFAVVKGAIPPERAAHYREKAKDWLLSFGGKLDFENRETWTDENLPSQNVIRTFASYCVAHEKFMWDARQETGVLDAFSRLWGTDKLLVSFDSLNVTFPNRLDVPRRQPWEHIDQSPLKRGVHCVQGIINLSPSGPEDGGLVVYPRSHRYNDELFDSMSVEDKQSWLPLKDIYFFKKEQLDWFHERGVKAHKVCAEPGDLILWDSRTIHYGSDPMDSSSQIRTAIYAAYTPASMASPDQLALKKQVFEKYGGTTHWPHDHIVVRNSHVMLPDGSRDPRDRDEPLEMPEKSDQLLRLAGVKAYD
ncbi:unnamed protein product [Clonostachys rosea]|uniref:Phytanoyl-CoA dioxygenase n=1 Tax=Bionectria ochroleuca TaxID=29856 RepID=A0ABY6TQL1_BIOOC|nr:unnamed protein product [Clonostachys rosea]